MGRTTSLVNSFFREAEINKCNYKPIWNVSTILLSLGEKHGLHIFEFQSHQMDLTYNLAITFNYQYFELIFCFFLLSSSLKMS